VQSCEGQVMWPSVSECVLERGKAELEEVNHVNDETVQAWKVDLRTQTSLWTA
jgi:hypothetical protein